MKDKRILKFEERLKHVYSILMKFVDNANK